MNSKETIQTIQSRDTVSLVGLQGLAMKATSETISETVLELCIGLMEQHMKENGRRAFNVA